MLLTGAQAAEAVSPSLKPGSLTGTLYTVPVWASAACCGLPAVILVLIFQNRPETSAGMRARQRIDGLRMLQRGEYSSAKIIDSQRMVRCLNANERKQRKIRGRLEHLSSVQEIFGPRQHGLHSA